MTAAHPVSHDCSGADDGSGAGHRPADHAAVQLVQVREACQSPSLIEASSASRDAKIAWMGIRPLATS